MIDTFRSLWGRVQRLLLQQQMNRQLREAECFCSLRVQEGEVLSGHRFLTESFRSCLLSIQWNECAHSDDDSIKMLSQPLYELTQRRLSVSWLEMSTTMLAGADFH